MRRVLLVVLLLVGCARVASAADLESGAQELGAALGIPVRVERTADPAPRVVLWVGPSSLPSIAVVDRRAAGSGGPEQRALDLARRLGGSGAPDYAFALVVADHDVDGPSAVEFDRNFPTRWGAARAVHGASAGHFPGQRGDVAALVDWSLDAERETLLGVLVLGEREREGATRQGGAAPAGSLRAFVEESLGRRFARVEAEGDLVRAARELHAAASGLVVRTLDVRPLGGQAWVADLRLERPDRVESDRKGPDRAGTDRNAAVQGESDALRCRVILRAEGAGAPWLACAVEAPDGSGYRVVPLRGGSVEIDVPRGGTGLRLIVHSAEESRAALRARVQVRAPGLVPSGTVVPFERRAGGPPEEPVVGKNGG